jgi:hypothetical protein
VGDLAVDALLRRHCSLTCGFAAITMPGKMGRSSMSAFPSMSSCNVASMILAGLLCAGPIFGQAQGQGASGQDTSIPNFSPSSTVGWLKSGVGDEFLPPDAEPGPVVSDPSHSFVGSFLLTMGNAKPFKIADLSNPILQPWVVEKMRKTNEQVLAGKVGFTARSRCWPHGVPGFLLYPVRPTFFIQTGGGRGIAERPRRARKKGKGNDC